MSAENLNQPVLTKYLSDLKYQRGVIDELTKNKGIEIQIRTSKLFQF